VPFPRKFLNDGEDIVLDLHPHWWYFVKPTATLVLLLVGVGFAYNIDYLPLVLLGLALINLLWLGWRYLTWVTNNFVLTTDRLIDRQGVLAKHVREIPLERINDLSINQSFFERIIGAGDVMVESAGERGQEPFADLPKPQSVQNAIYAEMERSQTRSAQRASAPAQLSVPEQIEKLDELRQRGVISQAEFDAKKAQLLDRM
jgi:uncharacterized membrane protein YdbT with pleckstrin-like domain